MTHVRPYAVFGPLDEGMVNQLITGLGPGTRLKLRCPKCQTRIRRWKLPPIQNVNGYPRSMWACHCAVAMHFSGLPVCEDFWIGMTQAVERFGYLEISDPLTAPIGKLRPLAWLPIDPNPLFSDS